MAWGSFCFAYILNEYTNSVSIFHLRRNKYCYEKHRRTQYRSNSLAYLSRAQAQQRVGTTNCKSFEINSRLGNREKFFGEFSTTRNGDILTSSWTPRKCQERVQILRQSVVHYWNREVARRMQVLNNVSFWHHQGPMAYILYRLASWPFKFNLTGHSEEVSAGRLSGLFISILF